MSKQLSGQKKTSGTKTRHREKIKDGIGTKNDIGVGVGVLVCVLVCVCLGCADRPSAEPPSRRGPPSAGPPQIRSCFSLFSLSLSLSLGVFSWNFGGVFEGRDPLNVHVWALGLVLSRGVFFCPNTRLE